MGEWVRAHPEAVMGLAHHARALRPFVSAGVRLGLIHDLFTGRDGALEVSALPRRPRGMTRSDEVDDCMAKAAFLGRWFAEQPDLTTALAIWGLRV